MASEGCGDHEPEGWSLVPGACTHPAHTARRDVGGWSKETCFFGPRVGRRLPGPSACSNQVRVDYCLTRVPGESPSSLLTPKSALSAGRGLASPHQTKASESSGSCRLSRPQHPQPAPQPGDKDAWAWDRVLVWQVGVEPPQLTGDRGLQQFLMWDPGAKESLPYPTDKTPTDPTTQALPHWPRSIPWRLTQGALRPQAAHPGPGRSPPTCTFGFSSQRGVGQWVGKAPSRVRALGAELIRGGGGEPLPSGVLSVPCLVGRTGEQ